MADLVVQQIDIWLKPRLKVHADSYLHFDIQRMPMVWREGAGGWPLVSQILLCPWCTDPWAWLKVEGEELHDFQPVSCLQCNRGTPNAPVPGSIIYNSTCHGVDQVLLQALPEELLKREFTLMLKAFEDLPCIL